MGPKYKVGLVAGAFDIIHPGYIRMFKDAKRVCEYLIVALQDDPSADRPKTKFKPIFTKEERLEILMAIKYVDEVRFYQTENELFWLISEIKPDVRILGSDYKGLLKTITGKGKTQIYYHTRKHDWSATKVRQLMYETMKGRMK